MIPIIKLQTKTDAELMVARTSAMTRRELLIDANLGSDRYYSEPVRKYREDGQVISQIDQGFDVETNVLLHKIVTTWTYYKTGEVDTITVTETDARGAGTKKTIKHYLDKQPTVMVVKVSPVEVIRQ